jgi:hypothetical protein
MRTFIELAQLQLYFLLTNKMFFKRFRNLSLKNLNEGFYKSQTRGL